MTTYLVYILDTTRPLAPVTSIGYVKADKYGPAWQGARATLNGDKAKGSPLYADPACTTPLKHGTGDNFIVAKITDPTPRKAVKIDKAALTAILEDPKVSAADKLAAMAKLIG